MARPSLFADRFELLRLLGEGGEAVVWVAREGAAPPCALKILRAERTAAGPSLEAQALHQLGLPGVVRLLDHGVHQDQRWLALELVPGAPFPGLPLPAPWSAVAPRFAALLQALGSVHAQGVVHADLKPNNVLVSEAGHVTLLDFGTARVRASAGPSNLDVGEIIGTPPFLAPELAEGQAPTIRSDLYAVGVMATLALTGRPPWPEGDAWALHDAVLRRPPEPLPDTVPAGVAALIGALLSAAPSDRPTSALDALDRLLAADSAPLRAAVPEEGPPLGQEALRALFWGPDVLHHLAEDAAAALWVRTWGERAAINRTLQAWVWAGLAAVDQGRYRVTREALARLASGVDRGLGLVAAPPLEGMNPGMLDFLACVALAGPDATATHLARLHRSRPEQTQKIAAELVRRGQLAQLADGTLQDRTGGAGLACWDPLKRAAAHRHLAQLLPAGHPRRLRHLLAGDLLQDAVDEAVSAARALLERGELAPALGLLLQAAGWVAGEDGDRVDRVARALVCAALASEMPGPLQVVDGALARIGGAPPLRALCAAARAALQGDAQAASAALAQVPDDLDPELDLWRQTVRVRAAALGDISALAVLLDHLEAWTADRPEREARLLQWRGFLAYRLGHYAQAAALFRRSAALRTQPHGIASALTMAAASALEAGDHDRALADAAQAEEIAATRRLLAYESRALRVRREAHYRSCADGPPDLNAADAAAALQDRNVAGQILLTEAAFAARSGQPIARALAEQASLAFSDAEARPGALLARCLAAAVDAAADPDVEILAGELVTCGLDLIALQGLGLLSQRLEDRPVWRRWATALPSPPESAHRREVLSPDEALAALDGAPLFRPGSAP